MRMRGQRRRYRDRCGVARALDVLGERWALLVVRELLLGPKRFTELRSGLHRIGPDMLAKRLTELQGAGVVRRTPRPGGPASAGRYELTDRGHELEPVILALGRWGSAEPQRPEHVAFGPDSAVLALKTLFSAERAAGREAEVELRLHGERFRALLADGRLDLGRGAAKAPTATLETDPATLAALLWRDLDPAGAEADGTLRLTGSRAAARRFLALFGQ